MIWILAFRAQNSAEKKLVLESLDVEAQKYFEECVSISSFDCHADSDDSVHEKENISTVRKSRLADGETSAKLVSAGVKGDAQSKDLLVGSDGVVLPWLKWEAESGGGADKNSKQVVCYYHQNNNNYQFLNTYCAFQPLASHSRLRTTP